MKIQNPKKPASPSHNNQLVRMDNDILQTFVIYRGQNTHTRDRLLYTCINGYTKLIF